MTSKLKILESFLKANWQYAGDLAQQAGVPPSKAIRALTLLGATGRVESDGHGESLSFRKATGKGEIRKRGLDTRQVMSLQTGDKVKLGERVFEIVDWKTHREPVRNFGQRVDAEPIGFDGKRKQLLPTAIWESLEPVLPNWESRCPLD